MPISGRCRALLCSRALRVFLFHLVLGVLVFAPLVIAHHGLFSVTSDFNKQQIPFAVYANDAVKAGNTAWDWSLDLGTGFVGGMSFYILGNPSFWLSMLFPSSCFMYAVGWLYALKYAVAGLTSWLWIRRYVKDTRCAVIGSVMYAFSGFMATNLIFYHFHDVVMLFPLLLLSMDMLMEDGKRGPFIWAVLANAVVSYFFFAGEVLFLVIYYVIRYVLPDRSALKQFPVILLEGALGTGIGAALLLPSFFAVIQNPRVQVIYNGSTALMYSPETYLYILKGFVFPGEIMTNQSAVYDHEFSSCSAYLPLAGAAPVIAYFMTRKKDAARRILAVCLVMALVPILNGSFSLFSGYYRRWFYMPLLIASLCSASVFEDAEDDPGTASAIRKGAVIWGVVILAFMAYLKFVPWDDTQQTLVLRNGLFILLGAVSLAGCLLLYLLFLYGGRNRVPVLLAAVSGFAVFTTLFTLQSYQQYSGEDAERLYSRIETAAGFPDPAPSYRYTNLDNAELLSNGLPGTSNFCSTVSGSIFRLYDALGLERGVKSPDPPRGFYHLVSAAYSYDSVNLSTGPKPFTKVSGDKKDYYFYRDDTVPPIGFTYDTYMTASELAECNPEDRAMFMLAALVVPDGKEEEVSSVLRHFSYAEDGPVDASRIEEFGKAHMEECSANPVRTESSYEASITADADKYAFFSIPNDAGWSASVNGQPAEILDVCGFMAVRVSEGKNRIIFTYRTPGLAEGIAATVAALGVSVLYCLMRRRRRIVPVA